MSLLNNFVSPMEDVKTFTALLKVHKKDVDLRNTRRQAIVFITYSEVNLCLWTTDLQSYVFGMAIHLEKFH